MINLELWASADLRRRGLPSFSLCVFTGTFLKQVPFQPLRLPSRFYLSPGPLEHKVLVSFP